MKNSFGSSPAAEQLERFLESDFKARRKISSLLSEFNEYLLKITVAKDPKTVRLCMYLCKEYILKRLAETTGLSEKIRTYTQNVIMFRYYTYRNSFDEVCSYIAKSGK